jgi:hypothetical protein
MRAVYKPQVLLFLTGLTHFVYRNLHALQYAVQYASSRMLPSRMRKLASNPAPGHPDFKINPDTSPTLHPSHECSRMFLTASVSECSEHKINQGHLRNPRTQT